VSSDLENEMGTKHNNNQDKEYVPGYLIDEQEHVNKVILYFFINFEYTHF